MKLFRILFVLVGVLLFSLPVSHAASPDSIETGTLLEGKVAPIDGSPFYLEYKDGKTLLHDVKLKSVTPIDHGENLSKYGPDGLNISWSYVASVDGQEFIAIKPSGNERLRVKKNGEVIPFTFNPEIDGTNLRLISYDASRNVMLWMDGSTYKVVATDLNGTLIWECPTIARANVFLAASKDEVLIREQRNLIHVDLKTGEQLQTIPLPSEPRDVKVELTTDQLFFMAYDNLFIYDIANRSLTKINLGYENLSDLTVPVYYNEKYYGITSRNKIVEIDVANKKVVQLKLGLSDQYAILQGGVIVKGEQRLLSLDRVRFIPVNLTTGFKAVEESGRGNTFYGETYQLIGTITTSSGEIFDVPVSELGAEVITSNRVFSDQYTVELLEAFDYKIRYEWLESKSIWVKPVKKLPLTIDTSFDNGPVGEITGTTTPNATVYLSCDKEVYSACSGSVIADETGRFTFSRGIILDDQTIKLWVANNYEYHKATEASVQRSLTIAKATKQDTSTVLTKTSVEGVTIKTVPHAKVEVRQIFSTSKFSVTEVTADAAGVARLTQFDSNNEIFYKVFYRVLGAGSPYQLIHVYEDYPMPKVTWVNAPKTGDTTITVYNHTLDPMLTVYRNGRSERAKRLELGKNVIELKEPLYEGQTIKLVASFRPEISQTMEQKVTSDPPKTLTVKDVLVTSSKSTFTVLKDAPAYLYFIVNGKPISYTEVGKDKYQIAVTPGTKVVIESSIGSKRKQMTYTIPNAKIASLSLTDELSNLNGKTFPNATVTIKAGTKVIASTKANSTGSYNLKFTRQKAGTVVTFESKAGIYRDTKKATFKAGIRPTISVGTIRPTTTSIAVRTNIPYGTVNIYNGKTLVAKKTIVSTTTSISFKAQRKGTKLTFKVVTPANRTAQVVKTVL